MNNCFLSVLVFVLLQQNLEVDGQLFKSALEINKLKPCKKPTQDVICESSDVMTAVYQGQQLDINGYYVAVFEILMVFKGEQKRTTLFIKHLIHNERWKLMERNTYAFAGSDEIDITFKTPAITVKGLQGNICFVLSKIAKNEETTAHKKIKQLIINAKREKCHIIAGNGNPDDANTCTYPEHKFDCYDENALCLRKRGCHSKCEWDFPLGMPNCTEST